MKYRLPVCKGEQTRKTLTESREIHMFLGVNNVIMMSESREVNMFLGVNNVIMQGTWMNIINHGGWRFPSGDSCVRSLDLEGPQVWFRVYTALIHQRQTGQEQDLLLLRHGTEGRDVHSDGVDAVRWYVK